VEISSLPEAVLQQKCGAKRAKHQGFGLKKDIHTRDKHKFLSPWEGQFIIVEEVTPGAYMLAEVDGGMLPNTWNTDQLRKYYD
jgi:hypothetical protein